MKPESSLEWLNSLLWPSGGARMVAGSPGSPRSRWLALPDSTEPATLIPAFPLRAASRAAVRHHDGKAPRQRLVALAAELALAVGAHFPLARALSFVEVVGDPDAGLPGSLRRLFGRPEMTFAVALGSAKSNRKPVLQLLDGGACIGFAKVAADPWTAHLVESEAGWLLKVAAAPAPLVAPRVLFFGELAGTRVLVVEALDSSRLPRRRSVSPPPAHLFETVADIDRPVATGLAEGRWWSSVLEAGTVASEDEAAALEGASVWLDRDLRIGSWHGDLAPWNLLTARRRIGVIDWEMAASDAPFGFDLCHFHVQAGMELLGLGADDALARARALSVAQLSGLGVAEYDLEAVWCLYLVELLRRQLELRANSVAARILQGPAALRALSASTAPARRRGAVARRVTRHETAPLRNSDRPEEQVVRAP